MGVAVEYNSEEIIGDIKVYIDFKKLQVKVPIIFFGTPGFSARMDGRYKSTFQLLLHEESHSQILPKAVFVEDCKI